jgi:hypothetical protein
LFKNVFDQEYHYNKYQAFLEIKNKSLQKYQKQRPLKEHNENVQQHNNYHEEQHLNQHLLKQYPLSHQL